MVSSGLDIELQELLDTLDRVQREFSNSPEYKKVRPQLPDDWPM